MKYKMNYTLYKRGRYWYYRTYTSDGKRTCGRSTGQTVKSKAVLFCDELFKYGKLESRADVKFVKYAEGFFDEGGIWYNDRCGDTKDGSMPLSYSTLVSMRSSLRKHLIPYWGNFYLSQITLSEVKKFRIGKLSEGVSTSNVRLMILCMKTIFDSAIQDNIISINPCSGLKRVSDEKDKKDALVLDDVINLCIRLSSTPRLMVLVITGVCTGMRASELSAIRPDTIHDGYIEVKDQRALVKGERCIIPTKTKQKRYVPMPKRLQDMLMSQVMDDGFCFLMFDKTKINSVIKTIRGGRNITFHSTRRFFNTYMLSKNVPPIKVAAVMGHSAGESKMQDLYSNWKADHFPEIYKEQEILLDKILSAINNE